MKLTWNGLKDKEAWAASGITLPSYDAEAIAAATAADPKWVHFGIGNIFRIFVGGIADRLLENGDLDRGITCVETFDYDVVDKVYRPYDNLALNVILHTDGSIDKHVSGALSEAVKAQSGDAESWNRLKEIFTNKNLQMVSFTITEKGYALKGADGDYLGYVKADIENGPEKTSGAMAIVTAMLHCRFLAGKAPLALVSMDNCSHNGEKLREAVLEVANAWAEKGFVEKEFIDYISDESIVAFPWTMIDKITPRPSEAIAKMLTEDGVEDMDIVVTSKMTYIAPFVNAEGPQYLVIEDNFPNGRPALEKGGVYMTDRETVNKSERMKVTICLNPLHTALCTYGCMLNYELFADCMGDPQLLALANLIGLKEGMDVVESPKILSPEDFIKEVIEVRFPNPYLGDTTQRIAVDISQMVGIRFGENVKAYVAKYGSADRLIGIPLAIAGWIRYLLAIDDNGESFRLAPDPMIPELQAQMSGIAFGDPASLTDQLRPILSNVNIFGSNLYEAGIGELIEEMVRKMLAGPGAVRKLLVEYLG